MREELISVCKDLGLRYETHDAHGFYLDVWPTGENMSIMLDASPENIWKKGVLLKSYPNGLLVVRDHTHHYSKHTHLAQFDMDGEGIEQLKHFLKKGYEKAVPIDSLSGIRLIPEMVYRCVTEGGGWVHSIYIKEEEICLYVEDDSDFVRVYAGSAPSCFRPAPARGTITSPSDRKALIKKAVKIWQRNLMGTSCFELTMKKKKEARSDPNVWKSGYACQSIWEGDGTTFSHLNIDPEAIPTSVWPIRRSL